MNNHSKGRWHSAMAVLTLAAMLAPVPVYGQATTYARLLGTVTDQTGAVVPGVEVEATATNVPPRSRPDRAPGFPATRRPGPGAGSGLAVPTPN